MFYGIYDMRFDQIGIALEKLIWVKYSCPALGRVVEQTSLSRLYQLILLLLAASQ